MYHSAFIITTIILSWGLLGSFFRWSCSPITDNPHWCNNMVTINHIYMICMLLISYYAASIWTAITASIKLITELLMWEPQLIITGLVYSHGSQFSEILLQRNKQLGHNKKNYSLPNMEIYRVVSNIWKSTKVLSSTFTVVIALMGHSIRPSD